MSLIEEALRKQEYEEAKQTQPRAPEAPLRPIVAPAPVSPPLSARPVVSATPASVDQDQARGAKSREGTQPPSLVQAGCQENEGESARQAHGRASARAAAPEKTPLATEASSVAPATASPVLLARHIHPDVGRQRNLTVTMLAGIGVLVLLLLAGAAFLVLVNQNRPARSPALVPIMALPAITPAAVAPATQAAAAAMSTAEVANLVLNVTSAVERPTNDAAAVAPAPAAVPRPAHVVIWPEVVVKGTFSGGGKTLVLLGEGLTLEIGATTPNGVRLLEAGTGWVRVSYKGQIRTYRRNGGAFTTDAEATSADAARP